MSQVVLYDTTLRDGAQMEGISLSVADKLRIVTKLDELGVHYIEGGYPGSNPKDDEFFRQAQSLRLEHATLTAFGSTRRAGGSAEADANLQALLDSGAPVITLVGKTWDMQVERVLETSVEENLNMIRDSIGFLIEQGRRVFSMRSTSLTGIKQTQLTPWLARKQHPKPVPSSWYCVTPTAGNYQIPLSKW